MLTSSNSQRGNVANQTELDFDLFVYLFIFSPQKKLARFFLHHAMVPWPA